MDKGKIESKRCPKCHYRLLGVVSPPLKFFSGSVVCAYPGCGFWLAIVKTDEMPPKEEVPKEAL